MPTDFRDGKTYPRPGRTMIDGYAWLARMSDKARAVAAGTSADYMYPCPLDFGMLDRWGISASELDRALLEYDDDQALAAWLSGRVNSARRELANHWILQEKADSLLRQDEEELQPVAL